MTKKEAPAKIMFCNRNFSTRVPERVIPLVDDQLHENDKRNKEIMKRNAKSGDGVM